MYYKFNIDKFSRDIYWNIGSVMVMALGGFLVNFLVIKFRGAAALGIFNQVYALFIILTQIGVGGLQFSVLKYISHNQNDLALCSQIATAALILVVVISAIIAGVCAMLSNPIGHLMQSDGVVIGLLLVAPGLIFFALNKVLINILNGLQHMRAFAIFRSLRFILIPVFICIIIIIGLSDPFLTLSLTISELLLFTGLIMYIQMRLFPICNLANIRPWFSKHLSFGIRGAMSGIMLEMNTRIDILMLGYFSTDSIVGIYSFATGIAEGFGQIPLAVGWNVDPLVGQYFSQHNKEKIEELAKRVKRSFYPIVGFLGAIFVLIYPLFYRWWISDQFVLVSWSVFSIIMLGVVLNAGYKPFCRIFLQGGRPGSYTFFVAALVIADALLNLITIPLWGIYGAAMVTGFTYILEVVILVFFTRKLFGVRL